MLRYLDGRCGDLNCFAELARFEKGVGQVVPSTRASVRMTHPIALNDGFTGSRDGCREVTLARCHCYKGRETQGGFLDCTRGARDLQAPLKRGVRAVSVIQTKEENLPCEPKGS